ncbi:MAG: hypothetical protein B6U87_02805 [Candidatus Aenigmarchaeota archaeon ex4484_52]|nr:MAG: hypothetical protein B6U87_02805 [Candidatus Aenigmarchaeota archaeon ex4484_52]
MRLFCCLLIGIILISGCIDKEQPEGLILNKTIDNYSLIGYSNLQAGEIATFKIGIPNPTNRTKKIHTFALTIWPPHPPIGGSWSPFTGTWKNNLKIPPNGKIVNIDLKIPSDFSSAKYLLRIYQLDNKDSSNKIILEKSIDISSVFVLNISFPKKIIQGKSFLLKVKIKNTDNKKIIKDVICMLDTHFYFDSISPISKMSGTTKEVGKIKPGEEKEIIWNLTPKHWGNLRIDITIDSKNAGSLEISKEIITLQNQD